MKSGRKIIIGDIHGCIEELKQLLKKVAYQPGKDRIISVGDVIRKGPQSLECLQFLKNCSAQIIMGNHELFFLEVLRGKAGSRKDIEDLKLKMGAQLEEWVKYISAFPSHLDFGDCLVVHAGLVPGRSPKETPVEILCNIRTWAPDSKSLQDQKNPAWFDYYHDKKLVVFGHWAKLGLVERENVVGLDSGCVYGKELSALILPDRKIVQVRAKKVYCPIPEKNTDS